MSLKHGKYIWLGVRCCYLKLVSITQMYLQIVSSCSVVQPQSQIQKEPFLCDCYCRAVTVYFICFIFRVLSSNCCFDINKNL